MSPWTSRPDLGYSHPSPTQQRSSYEPRGAFWYDGHMPDRTSKPDTSWKWALAVIVLFAVLAGLRGTQWALSSRESPEVQKALRSGIAVRDGGGEVRYVGTNNPKD